MNDYLSFEEVANNSAADQVDILGLSETNVNWRDSIIRDKAYTNLREGNYTFHVRSKNIYGQISESNSYSFKVSPPWYRSALAYLIYFILILEA